MATWQELNNKEDLGGNVKKTIGKKKLSNKASIDENVIDNLYRMLSLAQCKAKERCKQVIKVRYCLYLSSTL